MFRAILLYGLLANTFGYTIVNPGPAFPPTEGEIWPQPQQQNKTSNYFAVNPHFHLNITGKTCPILQRAIRRYTTTISSMSRLLTEQRGRKSDQTPKQAVTQIDDIPLNSEKHRTFSINRPKSAHWYKPYIEPRIEKVVVTTEEVSFDQVQPSTAFLGTLQHLNVELTEPCEQIPHLNMIEHYNLNVSSEGLLMSSSVWGILRGLESFSQLLYYSAGFTEIRINATSIIDYPRYKHRGLLVDTSRHYISLGKILETIDAMAYNKMNVFHWHIVDDQSFPYVSTRYPDISARGAYHESAVYKAKDVARVIRHARDRGIRVVAEFDIPGHTRSWGESFPQMLTKCYNYDGELLGLGPMNPIKPLVYTFLKELLKEVSEVFSDKYLHVGGDEVDHDCWITNPEIINFMEQHNMSTYSQLHELFMSRVISMLPTGVQPIVWQEVVDIGVKLPPDSLVQIWKSDTAEDIMEVIDKGYRVLYSTCWYLDHVGTGGDWIKYYDCDPREIVRPINNNSLDKIVGGEACMWSEVVDDNNIISRVWPRASAAAEKLWSAPLTTQSTQEHYWDAERTVRDQVIRRMEEHVCRMQRRGIQAQPASGPGYCRIH